VPRSVRRTVFGRDPRAYDRYRLPYPAPLYQRLSERCGLGPGCAVLEIGPGTGIATRELLRRGADPLVLVEADPRLARFLRRELAPGSARLTVLNAPFERTRLAESSFDLAVAASSFHWLPPRRALRSIARALRPGGWWASWNQHHGDPFRPSRFHQALQPLYRQLHGGRPPRPPDRRGAQADRARRIADLRAVGAFDRIRVEELRWDAHLSTEHVTALWGTFSDVLTLPRPRRRWFLGELGRLVDREFGGEATIPILTPLYTARRR